MQIYAFWLPQRASSFNFRCLFYCHVLFSHERTNSAHARIIWQQKITINALIKCILIDCCQKKNSWASDLASDDWLSLQHVYKSTVIRCIVVKDVTFHASKIQNNIQILRFLYSLYWHFTFLRLGQIWNILKLAAISIIKYNNLAKNVSIFVFFT